MIYELGNKKVHFIDADLAYFGLAAGMAFLGACFIALVLQLTPFTRRSSDTADRTIPGETVFVFDGSTLIDASPDAAMLFSYDVDGQTDIAGLLNILSCEFPQIAKMLDTADEPHLATVSNRDPSVSIFAYRHGTHLRLVLRSSQKTSHGRLMLRLAEKAQRAQTALLHDISEHTAQIMWKVDDAGVVLWANAAYEKLAKTLQDPTILSTKDNQAGGSICIGEGANERWIDVRGITHGTGVLYLATDCTDLVHSQRDKRDLIETLGRTFAELSIGLAIFDKTRVLTLFNPAFLDMTGLPFDFLSKSPVIDTVLDRMREQRLMPEPKDYPSWRHQFTALEDGAKQGTYSKTWSLADGQVFRVTGRPYPDGAFALLFEDISEEISLTRRFRLDIETGQAVLDTLPDAIAVFSPTGTLVMSNTAYAALWDKSPDHLMEQRFLSSEIKAWKDNCVPSPIWQNLHDFIRHIGTQSPWAADAMLRNGRAIRCHATRLAAGMTLVRFLPNDQHNKDGPRLLPAGDAIGRVKG